MGLEQEIANWLGEQIVTWGTIAGGVSAIIALTVKLTKPIREHKKREKAELAEYRKSVKESIEALTEKMNELSEKMDSYEEDMVYQQRYDLKMAHARLMLQGWCSDEEKAAYLDMYDHYKINRKRNSLADSCKSDVNNLPNHPPEGE